MSAAFNSSRTNRLLQRLPPGIDPQALEELFARHQERLRMMIRLRMEGRLRSRISSSTVLQQIYLDIQRHIAEYVDKPAQPFFLWLRTIAGQRIQQFHRQYLGDRAREAGQELCPYQQPLPDVNAASMAAQLMGNRAANRATVRADILLRLQSGLNNLDPLDREILALRNLEELSNEEASLVLGIAPAAATVRYVMALKRFNEMLKNIPEFFESRGGSSGGTSI